MKKSTSEGKHEVQWTSKMQLDDLDFSDNLALLSHTQQQIQKKTTSAAASSAVSIIDEHGGSDADMKARIGKARAAYLQLRNIWNSKQMPTNTKVTIFNTNVKTVLLYEAGTWSTTKAIVHQMQVHYQQKPFVGKNKPDLSGGIDQEEVLEVDNIHIEESIQLHHKTSRHLESSRPKKEKRKMKELTTPGNVDRHEENEQELDRTRKEGQGQCWLKNAGRCPVLHWE
ncbi:unnamed protein product [Schistosoma curassoni]|uniref:DUF6451 domain-containing protein n=1 Tax=Schistosoma curassoni TaxID=6186 RepID=A0A183L0T6_9TREM|nr:unnamed protein product [Schistosoma curassoni]